jgi:hypothetical protein
MIVMQLSCCYSDFLSYDITYMLFPCALERPGFNFRCKHLLLQLYHDCDVRPLCSASHLLLFVHVFRYF